MPFEMPLLAKCLLAVALVAVNAFFVLVEFALVRARRTQLEVLHRRKAVSAGLALAMHRRMDRYLAASQLGITMASLALGWVGEATFAQLLAPLFQSVPFASDALRHTLSILGAFALITTLHIVLGEQVPKYIAISQAESSLRAGAPLMQAAYFLLWLPLMVLNSLSNAILKLLGVKAVTESEAAFSKEELRLVLSQSHTEGRMGLAKVLLCENVLDLGDFTARSIMTPLDQVAMLDLKKSWAENRAVILERRYSRYPLISGGTQKILGYVYLKELMLVQLRDGGEIDLERQCRQLPRVEASTTVEALLPAIQRFSTNMTLVMDKGRPVGIVTFEDVLEELVGEIVDEYEAGRVWRLGDCLDPKDVLFGVEAEDLTAAVRALAERLVVKVPGMNAAQLCERVLQHSGVRGRFTAVGHGLALPHARCENLPGTLIAYGRLAEPIEVPSPDGVPVQHLFLILTPREKPREQLRALARISMLFTSDVLSLGLADAETPQTFVEVIRAADSLTPLDTR